MLSLAATWWSHPWKQFEHHHLFYQSLETGLKCTLLGKIFEVLITTINSDSGLTDGQDIRSVVTRWSRIQTALLVKDLNLVCFGFLNRLQSLKQKTEKEIFRDFTIFRWHARFATPINIKMNERILNDPIVSYQLPKPHNFMIME